MPLPSHVRYLIIGAGVHGLSTAYHLALELKSRGRGGGRDILSPIRCREEEST